MKLAIQIVLYHRSKHFMKLLASLEKSDLQYFELFCYENSVNQEEFRKSKSILEASGLIHHILTGNRNIGFGNAHNALWRLHEAPFVLLLNDDAWLTPLFLEKALQRMEADQKTAAVSGLLYRWDGSADPCATAGTFIDTAGLEYNCLADIRDRFAGQTMKDIGDALQEPKEIFGVSGAIALLRRSAVESVSPEQLPFDPSFFMYKEDVDLAIRLRRGGFISWYEPMAVAFHQRGLKLGTKTWFARIQEERKRPKVLRQASLLNQWKLDIYHASVKLGWRDIFKSMVHEAKRKVLAFLSSPTVFFFAAEAFIISLPATIRRRRLLKQLLPDVRLSGASTRGEEGSRASS